MNSAHIYRPRREAPPDRPLAYPVNATHTHTGGGDPPGLAQSGRKAILVETDVEQCSTPLVVYRIERVSTPCGVC